jgi:hypothetical protein
MNGFNYAKEIADNWDSSITSLNRKFQNDTALKFMPYVDTSAATSASYMFSRCSNLESIPLFNTRLVENFSGTFYFCSTLKDIPILNTSSATTFTNAFSGCYALTDDSLNNILTMCINATSYTETKTLNQIGISNTTYYPASRIQALSNYQAFINAGWTIGY